MIKRFKNTLRIVESLNMRYDDIGNTDQTSELQLDETSLLGEKLSSFCDLVVIIARPSVQSVAFVKCPFFARSGSVSQPSKNRLLLNYRRRKLYTDSEGAASEAHLYSTQAFVPPAPSRRTHSSPSAPQPPPRRPAFPSEVFSHESQYP